MPDPALLPPVVAAPARTEEMAEDKLGARVAEGPAAVTWESNEEMTGRKELGNAVANEDRTGPAAATLVGAAIV